MALPDTPSFQTDSVNALYGEHQGWLAGWLRKKLGNSSDAADLVHDTFVRLLSKDGRGVIRDPRGYLTTIAGGLLADHWRRKAIEQAWLETLAMQPESYAPSAEERYLILETLEDIARLLDGLPPQVREVFLLSQLDGLTYPQIGSQLGLTVNVVQKAMTRAVTHCYKALYIG